MASEPNKKRKIDEAPFLGSRVSSNGKNVITSTNANTSMVGSQSTGKYFATTQAQQEGCTGNYKIFDSSFGNFLVPVVPTRAELS